MLQHPHKKHHEDEDEQPNDKGYVIKHRTGKKLEPISEEFKTTSDSQNAAIKLIQNKIERIYAKEPNVKKELQITPAPFKQPSKHQQIMYNLSISGRPLAQIQTAWHEYYQSLPDNEKHEVWQEFYETHAKQPTPYMQAVVEAGDAAINPEARWQYDKDSYLPSSNRRAISHIKKRIADQVSKGWQSESRVAQHVRSLIFGISFAFIFLCIFLFAFFNEVIITPFIQPSRAQSNTPIILSSDNLGNSANPEVIIPKINVEIPTIFSLTSTDEADIQNSLQDGVIHYPSTVLPGQQGNAAFFGHSSNNIFNRGKYKFAFVLLHELVPGDIFYLTYNKTVYTYRVFSRTIVPPSNVSVLNNISGKTATATLITCDPPGTSNNRLVVVGEQIDPDPASAQTPVVQPTSTLPAQLTGNGPSLFSRFWNWLFQ